MWKMFSKNMINSLHGFNSPMLTLSPAQNNNLNQCLPWACLVYLFSATLQARFSLLRLNRRDDQQLLLKTSGNYCTMSPQISVLVQNQYKQRLDEHKEKQFQDSVSCCKTGQKAVEMQRINHNSSREGRSGTQLHNNTSLTLSVQRDWWSDLGKTSAM